MNEYSLVSIVAKLKTNKLRIALTTCVGAKLVAQLEYSSGMPPKELTEYLFVDPTNLLYSVSKIKIIIMEYR